jgi:hypothetical protein
LRRSEIAWLKGYTHHHARSQVSTDQGKQPLVAHLSGHAGHQDIELNIVEKSRQGQIDGDAIAFLDIGLHLLERSMSGAIQAYFVEKHLQR